MVHLQLAIITPALQAIAYVVKTDQFVCLTNYVMAFLMAWLEPLPFCPYIFDH